MEYTLASFVPVILAAVSADAITVNFFGSEPASRLFGLSPVGPNEIPLMVCSRATLSKPPTAIDRYQLRSRKKEPSASLVESFPYNQTVDR